MCNLSSGYLARFTAGQKHEFSVKRVVPLVMRLDRAAPPVQIMVIKPLDYRLKKEGKLLYQQPAFLVCTDPGMALRDVLQNFLWRSIRKYLSDFTTGQASDEKSQKPPVPLPSSLFLTVTKKLNRQTPDCRRDVGSTLQHFSFMPKKFCQAAVQTV